MLSVKNLHAYYGKSHIIQGVDMHINKGEIVSLLGRNGVGRSTTCKALMGLVKPHGEIIYNGKNIAGLPTHKIARLGIGYVPEDRQIFPGLTTKQNLELGIKSKKQSGGWSIEDAYELFPRLAERADTPAEVLSGGEQQMLSMCRTLLGNPDFIMIDEPTECLAPFIVEQVGEFLVEVASRGVAILLVEQKLDIALRISQRLYVMGQGKMVFEGDVAALQEHPEVRKEWLEV